MPLEDEFSDILKKARTGQGLSVDEVARKSGLATADITAWERGQPPGNHSAVQALAGALGLRPAPLAAIALDHWEPRAQEPLPGVEVVQGSINGYGVQGYLVHDGGQAVAVDTAYNAAAVLDALARRGATLVAVCLTHGHADHAEGIDILLKHYEVPVYLGADDADLLDWRPPAHRLVDPEDGLAIHVGRRVLSCLVTPGHTPGGVCYRMDDAVHPLCFVGDTLFAGSIGRSNPSGLYAAHLASVRRRVLALTPDTRLCPGHGPSTTVEEELAHNPFYAPD